MPRALILNLGDDRVRLFKGGTQSRGHLFNFAHIMVRYDHFFLKSHIKALGLYNFIMVFGWAYKPGELYPGSIYKQNKNVPN